MSDAAAENKIIPESVILITGEREFRVIMMEETDSFYNIDWNDNIDIVEAFKDSAIYESLGDALHQAWTLAANNSPGIEANVIIHQLGRPFPTIEDSNTTSVRQERAIENKVRQILSNMLNETLIGSEDFILMDTRTKVIVKLDLLTKIQTDFCDTFYQELIRNKLSVVQVELEDDSHFPDTVLGHVQSILDKFGLDYKYGMDYGLSALPQAILHAFAAYAKTVDGAPIFSHDGATFLLNNTVVHSANDFVYELSLPLTEEKMD